METINERLRILRKALLLKQDEIARKIGVGSAALSKIETGATSLTDSNVLLICTPSRLKQGITVNEDWLRKGQGEMFLKDDGWPRLYDSNENELPLEERELVGIYRDLLQGNKEIIRESIKAALAIQKNTAGVYSKNSPYPESANLDSETREPETSYLNDTESMSFKRRNPLNLHIWGISAAGNPREVGQFNMRDETRPCDPDLIRGDPAEYGWIKVEGSSMSEAGIKDGDWAVVRHATAAEHGEIMLVHHGDDITLKRIKTEEGPDGREEVWMCWEDGSGQRIRLDDEEYGIQGKFVTVERK